MSDRSGLRRTALALFVAGLVLTIMLLVFEPGLRRGEVVDLEAAARVAFGLEIGALIVGLFAWCSASGKIAVVGSAVLVALFLSQLLRGPAEAPAEPEPAKQGAPQPAKPFLGVPDDQERTLADENPEADPRLRGIVTVTRVQPADYGTYVSLKDKRKIVAQERRGDYTYFSVEADRHVLLPPTSQGGPMSAQIRVTERFKVRVPGTSDKSGDR